jgi:hypothetical protein
MVKAAGRAALSPSNLLAIAAALGATRAARHDGEDAADDERIVEPTSH